MPRRAGRWFAAGSLLLLGGLVWASLRHPSSSPDGAARPESAGAVQGSAEERGVRYLDQHPFEQVGLEHTKSTYPFAMSYPEASDLGNHFVAASLLETYAASGHGLKAKRIGEYLARQQETSGIIPFDRYRFSVDADTTLGALIALHGIGTLQLEQARRAFETFEEHHRVDCGYRTYRASNIQHSIADAHPEIAYNVLYMRSIVPDLPGPPPACIARAVVEYQEADGAFPSYWYPERLHVHYHALRALHHHIASGSTDAAAREALQRGIAYLLGTQGADGGWGEPSNAFDTAYALLALRAFGNSESERHTSATARGREFLVRAQLEDGSWPGIRIFYWYYPNCPDKSCPEEWHDRGRRIMTTAAAVQALASLG